MNQAKWYLWTGQTFLAQENTAPFSCADKEEIFRNVISDLCHNSQDLKLRNSLGVA